VLAKASLDALRAYRWPGNIRELRNVIERAVLLADDVIELSHLPRGDVPGRAAPPLPESPGDSLDLKRDVDELERRRILEALERCGGNQTRAAKLLNISRTTLVMRLRDYGVRRPRS
jgi:transcriptional regulator with PAS, ATPase and Fis domain